MKRKFPFLMFTSLAVTAGLLAGAVVFCFFYSEPVPVVGSPTIVWVEASPAEHFEHALPTALMWFGGTPLAVFAGLSLLHWLWYFLLARLTELSKAIKTNP